MSECLAIVMAAGKGTRMQSDLPKVLCRVCERPMVEFVLDALQQSGVNRAALVVGYRADEVRRVLSERRGIVFVEQEQQLGTGHAVMVCRDEIAGHAGPVLVLAGDSPLTQSSSLTCLLEDFRRDRPACILGTLQSEDPHGLGRIVRDSAGNFEAIVEEKDATPEQRQINEVNMSTYVFDSRELLHALDHLDNDNQQGEYYITDCPGILKTEGKRVRALPVLQPCEALSVNTVEQLQVVEAEMERRAADRA